MRLIDEQLRGLVNAGQLYEGWKDVLVQLANMPGGMYWRVINSKEYLYQYVPGPVGLRQQTKSLGPRTPQAEDAYRDFRERKEALECAEGLRSRVCQQFLGWNGCNRRS